MGLPFGGGSMRAVFGQQRSLSYLESGAPDAGKTLRRLLQVLRPYRWRMAAGSAVVLLGVLLGLVPPLLIRALINRAIPTHNLSLAVWLALGMVAFPTAAGLVGVGQNYLATAISQAVIYDLRNALYRSAQRQGIDFFTWTRAGEIHSRFINDAGALQNVLTQSFLGTFTNWVTVTATVATMASLNWRLTLLSVLSLPAFALPVLHFGRRRYQAVTRTQTALAHLGNALEETLSLSGALVVKSSGTEAQEAQRFDQLNRRVRETQIAQSLLGQWLQMLMQALAALGPAVLYGYGAYLVMAGRLSLGTLVAFATFLGRLYAPASSLVGANTTLLGGLALFDRIFTFLDLTPSVPEPAHPRPLPPPGDGLRFRSVQFAYSGSAEPVLHEVSFSAPVGTLSALVGKSGAGKSTILALAARFYDPTGGAVTLDGVDLREVANPDLRRRVAMVTQEVFLFHGSLRENLCYGASRVTAAALARAVEAAQLEELLHRLPDGLDTVVGERGYRLSGGEKQRVAIARAILRDCPYLLLDEATSSLDSHSERLLQQALAALLQGRTVIAIAHRLSTILTAQQILVVDDGRIVARGTHTQLVSQPGLYQVLYREQFEAGWGGR